VKEVEFQIVFRPQMAYRTVPFSRQDTSLEFSIAVTAAWEARFPSCMRGADFEDWHEHAAKLEAAIETRLPVYAAPFAGEERTSLPQWRSFNTGGNFDHPRPDTPTIVIGRLLETDCGPCSRGGLNVIMPERDRLEAARRHYANPAFARHAGRIISIGRAYQNGDPDEFHIYPDLHDAIASVVAATGPSLAVKMVSEDKYAPVLMGEIGNPADRDAVYSWLIGGFGYGLIHVDNDVIPTFLVQQRVRMESEYRVVIIGGRAVAGAACIESRCPPYNTGDAFDPWVEGVRGDGRLRRDTDLVRRLVEGAEAAAADMGAADPLLTDGTFDMAVMDGREIGLVEVNPLGNFGLYAMRFDHVLAEMITTAGRRMEEGLVTAQLPDFP
jgi:hypothetical protein